MFSISPLDGRYKNYTTILNDFFSEKALIDKRIEVELEYLNFLKNILPELKDYKNPIINDPDKYDKIKKEEKIINHDVKAIEYYLRCIFKENNLHKFIPFIHIGLTSHDINSISKSHLLKLFIERIYIPKITLLTNCVKIISQNWNFPILGRTHGQIATPTNLKKEFMVFYSRLKNQINIIQKIKHRCKFGGATGGFNALHFCYPEIEWNKELDSFCMIFNLERNRYTTQIDHYDNFSEIFDCSKRINVILIDLCQDIWLYCSYNYFKLKIIKDEIGSSTMPHKINPINFENAEGNMKIANNLFNFLSDNLPISKLQRDLTDSTVSRNIGVPYGHTIIAFESIFNGLIKLEPNIEIINKELDDNYIVLGEAIQTVLRKNNDEYAYEKIKNLTRNNEKFNKSDYLEFIDTLNINENDKNSLKKLKPRTYFGIV